MNRWIVVTGMHRSGTSALSRVLNLLGVDLGDESRMIPAAEDNPRGFWENQSIAVFNDQILAAFGGTWDNPPYFPEGWVELPALVEARTSARALLQDCFPSMASTSGVHGWKDPRTSIVLPFWRQVVPVESTVLMLRNPLEVAKSLQTRGGTALEDAARLWLRYTLEAVRNDADHILVTYDALLADPASLAGRLVKDLDLEEPSGEAMAQIEDFVAPQLRRSTPSDAERGPYTDVACSLYEVMRNTDPSHYGAFLRVTADALIPAS